MRAAAGAYREQIRGRLASAAVAAHDAEPFGDTMIMNAAFLIERSDEERFAGEVERLGEELEPLSFRYSGPWPPYNFVRIRIQAGEPGAQSGSAGEGGPYVPAG